MRPLPLCVLLVSSSVSVCALAEETQYATVIAQYNVRTKMVSYADLDLQRHEAVVTLYRRIRSAADLVCYDADRRPIRSELNARRCISDATTRAVTQVGSPELTTLHAQHTHKATATLVAREAR